MIRKIFKNTTFLLLTVMLSSCYLSHEVKNVKPKETIESIEQLIAEKEQFSSFDDKSELTDTQSIINQLNNAQSLKTEQETILIDEKFDVSVKDIDARSFLLGLVDSTPYNMVINPDINFKISLQLKDVSIGNVLHALETVYPLMIEREGNVFYVSSAESMTMVYPIDYINLSRYGKSETKVAGQITAGQSNQTNTASNTSTTGSDSSLSSINQLNASEIKTESKINFWQELQASLNLLLKNEEKSSLVMSPHTGVIVVKALPKTQKLIQKYLNIIQSSLNRQVVLEAKIIEVTLSEGFQSGIDWSKINSVNNGDQLTFGQAGQVLNLSSSDAPLNGVFSLAYKGNSFNGALELLETQGDIQVLSSPRVSTINNQKAVIRVGSDEFFVTDVSTTTVTGNSTATTPDVTLTPFFSGISLDVTPQINAQGDIILHIHPVVSEVTDQQKTLILGQDEFTLPLALTNVRESDSIVRAKDNQVIMIGGLMQNKIENKKSSVPVLGSIPLVGKLFSQTRKSLVKSELVILLRTSLVNQSSIENSLEDYRNRLDNM